MQMTVVEKYKIYAHIFFGYIFTYLLFLFYVEATLNKITLKHIFTSDAFFFMSVFLFFLVLNKSILYYRQIKDGNFTFTFDSYFRPSRAVQLFGSLKSLFGIFFYSILNLAIVEYLSYQLEQTNPDATFLSSILFASYFIFPLALIAWDIKRLRFWPLKEREEIQLNREEQIRYARNMEKYTSRQDRPETLGTMTGYEPKKLESIELVPTPLMTGEPGAGLSGSSFSETNKRLGALGELNFAKVLQQNNYLDQFASYWSVQYPFKYSPGPDSTLGADIDCILITRKSIYLIDLKLYFQGNITWKTITDNNTIQAVDNVTGNWVEKPRKMNRNMFYATERIQEKIDQLGIKKKVKPYVVMMPTDRGLGKVENVFWPGQVECLSLTDFLKIIAKEKPFNAQDEEAEVLNSLFAWLVKNESGTAPRYNQ